MRLFLQRRRRRHVSLLPDKCRRVRTIGLGCFRGGCGARMFPAAVAWIRRGRRSVALRLADVLRGFVALLRAFATLGGFGLFQTGTRQVLGRPWLFVGGALRGMGTSWTLSAAVLLTGPDPVPQLPVNLDGSRSIRLHTKKNKELDFF